jgi:DNA-binding transcriptional LysR family regulator
MKIEHLREFIILARLLNFGKTAEKLYLTQPVLSRHIMAMEEEIGSILLVRNKQSVSLTEDGRLFLREAEQIVNGYELALEKVRANNKGGRLSIGMLYYSKELMIPAINKFQKLFPGVQLHFLSETPAEIAAAIMSDEIDVGALLRVDFEGGEHLKFFDIYQEPLVLMVSSEHRLSKRNTVSVKELNGERFVNCDDIFYRGYLEGIRERLAKYNTVIDQNPVLVRDYETLLLAVQAGRGVALLSYNMKKHLLPQSAYVELEERDITIRRCLAYKTGNNNPSLHHFIKQFSYEEHPHLR